MEEENQDYWSWGPDQKTLDSWEKEDYLWGSEYLWKIHCFGIPYYNPFRNKNQGMGEFMI